MTILQIKYVTTCLREILTAMSNDCLYLDHWSQTAEIYLSFYLPFLE